MIPFLKWAGGKRWLTTKHPDLFPKAFARYIEPFLGSACVFFHVCPDKALLGDTNAELVACYLALREDPYTVEKFLERHEVDHCQAYYYAVRDSRPRSLAAKAARTIYLNRTCFNGIYRVSLKGRFNVPRGTKDTVIYDNDDFHAISTALKKAEIRHVDFEELIDEAKQADFVFADPPYSVRHNRNAFVKYNEKLFSWDDQVRLADALARARDRGARILATNANHKAVRGLYEKRNFKIRAVSRFSSIAADGNNRQQYEELIVLDN